MLRILACCVNGSGIGLMMKMTLDKALNALGIKVQTLNHCRLEKGKQTALDYDIIFCPINFVDSFDIAKEKGVKVVGLKNVMSQKEMQDKLKEILHIEEN